MHEVQLPVRLDGVGDVVRYAREHVVPLHRSLGVEVGPEVGLDAGAIRGDVQPRHLAHRPAIVLQAVAGSPGCEQRAVVVDTEVSGIIAGA